MEGDREKMSRCLEVVERVYVFFDIILVDNGFRFEDIEFVGEDLVFFFEVDDGGLVEDDVVDGVGGGNGWWWVVGGGVGGGGWVGGWVMEGGVKMRGSEVCG